MSNLGLAVNISANTSNAIEAIGKLNKRVTDFQRGIDRISQSLKSVGSLTTKGITVPTVAATTTLALATKEAIQFNKKLSEVATLIPNISKSGFQKLSKDALELSKNIGVMPNDVLPALYQAISAGVPESSVFNFLETAGKASIAGVTDLTTSVDGLTSIVNAYGLKSEEVSKVSDILFTTVRLGKTDFSQLSKTLFNVIPTAASIGLKLEDVGAALATITAQGTPTSVATTQLRQALVELNKEGSIAYDIFLNISGKTFKDFIKSGGNLEEALQLMEKAASKNGKSINSMFSSVEAGNAVLQLTGRSSDMFKKSLIQTSEAAGATQKAFNLMDETPAQKFEKLKATFSALIIELGEKLLPVVEKDLLPIFKKDVLPIAERLIEVIGNMASSFNNLTEEEKKSKVMFMAIAIAVGPVLSGLSTAITTVKSLSAAMTILNTAILTCPVLTITAITVGLIALSAAAIRKSKIEKEALETSKKNTEIALKQSQIYINQASRLSSLAKSYDEIASKSEKTREEQEKQKKILRDLQELYPELNIMYDENGNVLGSLSKQVENYTIKKEEEAIAVTRSAIAEKRAILEKYKLELERFEKDRDIYGGDSFEKEIETTKKIVDELSEGLNKLNETENNLQANARARMLLSKQQAEELNNDSTKTVQTQTTTGGGSTELKDKIKTFSEYIKELNAVEKKYTLSVEQLKKLGKNIEADKELENKKDELKKIIEEMAGSIKLSAKEMETLKKSYGYVFDDIDIDKVSKVKKAVEENIEAYNREVAVKRKLGETIKDEDIAKEKTEILKNTVVDLAKELKLTDEQVAGLIESFKDLADKGKSNIEDKVIESLDYINDFASSAGSIFSSISSIVDSNAQREIDIITNKKCVALDAIEDEKKKRLQALNAVEKSEKEKLATNIKELKKRQKVAWGLYEQDRIKKDIEEEQAALNRVSVEEETQLKLKDAEAKFENEKLRIEYEGRLQSHSMQVASATTSLAMAAIEAVKSGLALPSPFSALAIASLLGKVTEASVNFVTILANKPKQPTFIALEKGGLVKNRPGGVASIIGEGRHDELVLPLSDEVFEKLSKKLESVKKSERKTDTIDIEKEEILMQPIYFQIDGKTIAKTMYNLSKRGVPVANRRGIT